MEPGTEIDLSDKAAWDDTALIEAYDRAISTYQEVHGSTPELLSVLRTKHCSRTAGSTPSKNLAHNLDEEGEEEEEEEEEDDGEEDQDRDGLSAEELAAAEAQAAAEAEAEAMPKAMADAAEEARRLAWARYYEQQQQQQQQQHQQHQHQQHQQHQHQQHQQSWPPPQPPPPQQRAYSASASRSTLQPPPFMHVPTGMNGRGPSASTAAAASTADYETDMSNLMMAWYHAGFFTAQFQERHHRR
jgi:chemotaxis protein histidine kinase CheA